MTARRPIRSDRLSERPEARANFLRKELRLFPSREVPAPVQLVVVNELRIGALGETPRRLIELIGKDAHGDRDADALDAEERDLICESLPIEARSGYERVRQPGKRD